MDCQFKMADPSQTFASLSQDITEVNKIKP